VRGPVAMATTTPDGACCKTPPFLNGSDLEGRPAFDEAGIAVRPDGRQLVIDAAPDPEADDHDIHPDHENEPETDDGPVPTPQGEDQCITGCSEDALRRLGDTLHSIERGADGVFITLTYHETDPTPAQAKADFEALWKRLKRWLNGEHARNISCVWKQEPQDRGTPHIHAIVYGTDFIDAQKISRLWHEVTGETSEAHRKSGVDVERAVNEDGKLQAYLAEYMAEAYDEWPREDVEYTGRWWGIKGRKHIPWAAWSTEAVDLDRHEAQYLIRELLDEWGVDIPDGVIPPSLTVNTRGDPIDRLNRLLDRL